MPEPVRRVALLLRDPQSSSSRVRLLQYRPLLEAAGIQVRTLGWEVSSRPDVARYAARAGALARWADVAVLQKPVQPPWLLRTLARAGTRLVVDVDDAVWVSGSERGRVTAASQRIEARLRAALDLAGRAVAGSEWLAERLRALAPGVEVSVVRPSVDLAAYEAVDRPPTPTPTIGWVGSAGNLADFRPEAVAGLRSVVDAGRARFVVVSSRPPEFDGLAAEFECWKLEDEVPTISTFDIGVMPLYDDERSRGRCGYKAIQYLAAASPVVASPVGSAPEIVQPERTGFLAATAAEWEAALRRLIDEPDERARLGRQGRAWVAREGSLEASFERLVDVLRGAAS